MIYIIYIYNQDKKAQGRRTIAAPAAAVDGTLVATLTLAISLNETTNAQR